MCSSLVAPPGILDRCSFINWKQKNMKECLGQIPRIIAALLISKIWVPLGNTGGTNVNAFQPMPIPDDLKDVLEQ